MGIIFGKTWDKLFNKGKDVRMVMVGLDAVGKTTIMYKMKLGDTVKTIPTIGFNVEQIEYKKLSITLWDIGGQDKIRDLWKHYYENSEAIIYVVDSSDTSRIELATEELFKMLDSEELKDAPLLIYANKQDLPGALSPSELTEKMNLRSIKKREWLVQGASARDGTGLTSGLDWMASTLLKRK
jgi:small GTP-binding protein